MYVDALRALIADRHEILTGQDNELIKHEMSVASKQAQEGQGHSPELLLKLLSIRNRLKPAKDLGSIRGMITELRELKTTLRGATEKGSSRAAAELLTVNVALGTLHQISMEQTKAVAGLDQEVELFRDTMNLRLDYYRQLQQISDTVAPYEADLSERARNAILLEKQASESRTKARIATLKSKGRYLVHLRDEATNAESQRLCIICQQPFEIGVLTSVRMPSFGRSQKLLHYPEISCYLAGTPCFGSKRTFLPSKNVSFLSSLPKKSEADSETCVVWTFLLCRMSSSLVWCS